MKQIGIILAFIAGGLSQQTAAQQVTLKGTVFDSTGTYPIELVSVISSDGSGTVTNRYGDYNLTVHESDSIWFSYLNKPTRKFAVKDIKTPFSFDISLQTYIPILPEARVRNPNYRQDSLQNRQDYAKVFNYRKPGLGTVTNNDGTAGLDLDGIINSFRFRKNRQMQSFQDRLISEERESYVRHRFSKALIRRITQEDRDSVINQFILQYLPSYLFTSMANDYTFHKYIKDSYERFKTGQPASPLWREGATGEEVMVDPREP
ncbi:hypothetical protein GCM10027051_17750 [Niabella terrae]